MAIVSQKTWKPRSRRRVVRPDWNDVRNQLYFIPTASTIKMFGKNIFVAVVMVVSTNSTAQYDQDKYHKITSQTSTKFDFSKKNCHELFARREGFEVGHVQFVHTQGKRYEMVTRSLRPLMFQIPDFLSSTDCDHIVELAEKKGLEVSKTIADFSNDIATPKMINLKISRYRRIGRRFANHLSSVEKMTEFISQAEAFYPREADAQKMFEMFDANHDNNITENELFLASDKVMRSLYNCLEEYKSSPLYRSRYSSQTWLPMTDELLHEMEEKIIQLTDLPKHIVEESEDLQVVHYSVNGHFHGHYDSTEDETGKNLPCCKRFEQINCHLCRYVTLLIFLNDVSLGGETVFPVADAVQVHLNQSFNLSLHCQNANIIVKPRKGTALMWYNHHLDPATGLLGNLDIYSLHGGCDVLQGSKWIANRWINIPKQHN